MGGNLGGEWIHVYVWLSPLVGHVWHVDVLLGIHGRYLLTALMVPNEIENSHALKKKKKKSSKGSRGLPLNQQESESWPCIFEKAFPLAITWSSRFLSFLKYKMG